MTSPNPPAPFPILPRGQAEGGAGEGALLDVRDLSVRYGSIEALRGVSLSVMPGEFVAIVGPNGAGKSTLVNTIAGLLRPARGTITFDGAADWRLSPARVVRRGIAQVPEGRQVFSELSVEDNLSLGAFGRYFRSPFLVDGYARLLGGRGAMAADLARVYALFPKLHDLRARLAGTLSGGEQQMLALGRALMSEARLLMIDELSLGLAPARRAGHRRASARAQCGRPDGAARRAECPSRLLAGGARLRAGEWSHPRGGDGGGAAAATGDRAYLSR